MVEHVCSEYPRSVQLLSVSAGLVCFTPLFRLFGWVDLIYVAAVAP